ncbi:MAG: GldM family protein [Chitinophagales bacterium]
MARSAKLKKGNIIFFILLIFGLLYYFNREQINKDLEDLGILPNFEEEETVEQPVEEIPSIDTETIQEELNKDDQEATTSKEPTFQILTKGGMEHLYIGENPIRIQANGIELVNVTPIAEGSSIDIETIDKERGLYNIKPQRKGTAKVNLFAKINGKYGVVSEHNFKVLPKPPPSTNASPVDNPMDDLLWIVTNLEGKEGVLKVGEDNPIEVAIAEVDSRTIRLQISGEGNTITPIDPSKGRFNLRVSSGNRVTLTVRAKVGGRPQIVGTKDFLVSENGITNTKNIPTDNKATSKDAKIEKSDAILYVGVDYPFNIEDPNIDTKNLQFKGENVRITGNNGEYVMKVTKAGEVKVEIYDKSSGKPELMETTIYQAEELPAPIAMIDGKTGGEIPVAKMKDIKNLEFGYKDLEIDVNFQLIRCKVTRYPADAPPEAQINGGIVFSTSTRRLFLEAEVGDLYRITDIKVKTSNHKFLEVKGISFEVK